MRQSRRYTPQAVFTMIALAALVLVFLPGCAKPSATGGEGAGDSKDVVVVTKADSDKTVIVAPGQTLEVVLEANPSTGYTWTVVSAPEFMTAEGEPEFASEAESGVVGAGGKQTLRFSVTAAGTGDLSLSYVRPWETGAAPAETFKAQVESK